MVREWKGKLERVTVLEKGFAWNGKSYASLSQIAKAMTGTAWNGHRFFGLRAATTARAALARRGLVSEATARLDVASAGPSAWRMRSMLRARPAPASIPTRGVVTIYSRMGDSFAYLDVAALILLAAWALARKPSVAALAR